MKRKDDQATEKRVSGMPGGGSRRHGDPPAWLDMSLPLQQRRELLDRSIQELRLLHQSALRRPRASK